MSLRAQLLFLRAAARSFEIADVDDCIRLVRTGRPHAQLFFSEIVDPRWLPILAGAGFFISFPGVLKDADGSTRYSWHPPLECLLKLASLVPHEVTSVLEFIDIPLNPAIQSQMLRTVAAIKDPAEFPALVSILQELVTHFANTNWLWLDDILSSWLQQGAVAPCFQVVRTYLREAVVASKGQAFSRSDWHVSDVDQKVISALSHKHPLDVASMICRLLITWADSQQELGNSEGAPTEDGTDQPFGSPPTYWLEEFGQGSFPGTHDMERTLANRLYAIGKAVFARGEIDEINQFDWKMRESQWLLFCRLRWQLYSEFPNKTLTFAREDALARIRSMGAASRQHEHEFALMLRAHAETNRSEFLHPDEVSTFVDCVLASPIGDVDWVNENAYRERFQRKQLYPVHSLLTGDALVKYEYLSRGKSDLSPDAFKPFTSGGEVRTITRVPPQEASTMAAMTDAELWYFLNTWQPKDRQSQEWWEEEDATALGDNFAELVRSDSYRFRPELQWWKNIQRAEILFPTLDRASKQLEKPESDSAAQPLPSEAEWKNWFGLAAWITQQRRSVPDRISVWNWPAIVVVKFLRTSARYLSKLPQECQPEVGALLRELFDSPDEWLREGHESKTSDWLTTAINSVRGTALEALLELALLQKRGEGERPESWIFDIIASRLRSNSESPATFSILGARLRLVLYLFGEQFKLEPTLLLREPLSDQIAAFLVAHFLYDNPAMDAVRTLPELPNKALLYLQQIVGQKNEDRANPRDFGSRLGTHLGFYYWNAVFEDPTTADNALDRFFAIATPAIRAATIRQIAKIFESSPAIESNHAMHQKVMHLWERRFANIVNAIEADTSPAGVFNDELGTFIDWFECECFPFTWRVDQVMRAIKYLEEAPNAYSLIEALDKCTAAGERLDDAVRILHALVPKVSDEFRWSYSDNHLKPLLEKGLVSHNPVTHRLTREIQESLLNWGLFTYLDM
jgi:hypothetical protein